MTADNPLYPLPPDYNDLTKEGQKAARLAVLRRQDSPQHYVEAWQFFRLNYLLPAEAGVRFYKRYRPSGPFHYNLVRDIATWDLNLEGAPRGSGKSEVGAMEQALFLTLTRPYFEVALCWATERTVKKRFNKFMAQLTSNRLIIQDFGPMRPARGEGTWDHELLMLKNGSSIEGFSVAGRQRGTRPDLYILDDPERDEDRRADRAAIQERFFTTLFNVVLPMLDEGACCLWVGTIIDRRSMFYIASRNEGDEDADPRYVKRFRHWNKRILDADDDLVRPTVWPAKFTPQFLKRKRELMGWAAYCAEYRNAPISEDEQLITLDPILHGYISEGPHPSEAPHPLACQTRLVYTEIPPRRIDGSFVRGPDGKAKDVERKEVTAAKLFGQMYRFMTVDWAWTATRRSDPCGAAIWGMSGLTLWLLDLIIGKQDMREARFIEEIFRLGTRWMPTCVGMEATGRGQRLYERSLEYIAAHGPGEMWHPRVLPIKYPRSEQSDKGSRFAAMEWRFTQGRVKVPWDLKDKEPWRQVWNQVNNFTIGLELLPHDEVIDLFSMTRYVVRTPKAARLATQAPPPGSFEAELELSQRTGLPIGGYMNAAEMAPEFLDALVDRSVGRVYHEGEETSLDNCVVIE